MEMNEEEGVNNNARIKDELLLLQSRTQKDTAKKEKEIKINKLNLRYDNEITTIIHTLPEDRTIIQRQKLQNFFRYTPFFQKLLKKNSIEKIQALIEKCSEKVQYRYFNQGDTVYKYMEKADSVYFIISGQVSVLIPKKYEQIEDEKMNKIQLQKNSTSNTTHYQNQRQQQYLPTIKSIGSSNQMSSLRININDVYSTSYNNQQEEFRINSLADIPLDYSISKDNKRIGIIPGSQHQLSPVRSSKLKRGTLLANQQYFFKEGADSPVKSIDNIRKLNSMSLIQEMEINKSRSFNYSPKKQHSSYNNSPDRNFFSSAVNRALLSPEKVYSTYTNKQNLKKDEINVNDIQDSDIQSSEKQPQINIENSHLSLSSEETLKNPNNLGLKLFKAGQSQDLDNGQSYFNNMDQGSDIERMITSFSQIPIDENDIISEKSEVDSIIGDSKNRTPFNEKKAETKKLSNLEKMFMSEPEFQLCFGDLYPHEINNCALYFFDGNTFKYNFGQRLVETQNTDTIDIIQKQPRSTTCVAITSLQLAQLDKNDYNDILKDLEELNLWRKVDQICKSFDAEKIPNLKKMIADIFPFLQKVVYQRGQLVFQEGEFTKGCYIIKKGEIELTKWSMIDPPQDFQDENQFRNWQSYCYPQEISLSLISQGQFFGEEDMLRNRKIRTFNAKCKSSECTVYFINKIHFLRIMYESNIVVDIFIKRAKLKDKWHKEKYQKMIEILFEDYSKRLGRNLFEEKKKEILGKKGREEIEKEKKEYKEMTGMFRDTYEKMIWKMSVADELNYPFKQKKMQDEGLNNQKQIENNEQGNYENLKQNMNEKIRSRSNSIDIDSMNETTLQKYKIKQYGRLVIQKGSKQTFLEEKMAILANLQERQVRQLAKKKQYLSQKTVENAINQTNLVKKSFKQQNNQSGSLSNYNSLQQQNNQEQIQNIPYVNSFSKQYALWKKRSQSLDKMKLSSLEAQKAQLKVKEIQQSCVQDNTPASLDLNIYNEPSSNNKNVESQFKQQTEKQDATVAQSQQNKQVINKRLSNLKIQNVSEIENKNKENIVVVGQQPKSNANETQQNDLPNEEQKQQIEEKERDFLATLTCKIQGYQEDLQVKLNKKKLNKKDCNEYNGEEKKLPVDFKIKTARSQAEAITSHFMNMINDQEKQIKKSKGKKVKRNKLDIIEYRLKGQVWAVMQMKRELAKFETKKQLNLRNDKSKAVIRSYSSPSTQQNERTLNTGLQPNIQIRQQDSQFHNIFNKIKNQIVEIQQDKINQNNVFIPAFSVFPYANNAEYILSHPLLNTQADNSNLAFKPFEQDPLSSKTNKPSESRSGIHSSSSKIYSKTESIQRRKEKESRENLDDIMLNEWNKVIQNVQEKKNDSESEQINLEEFNTDRFNPQPWNQQPLYKSNSIQALETYVENQKPLDFNSSSENEDDKEIESQRNTQNITKFKRDNYSQSSNASLNINSSSKNYASSQIVQGNYIPRFLDSRQKNGQQQQQQQYDIFRQNKLLSQDKNSKIVNYHTPQRNRSRSNKSFNQEQQMKPNNGQIIGSLTQRKRIMSHQISSNEKIQNEYKSLDQNNKNEVTNQSNGNGSAKCLQNQQQKDRNSTLVEELNVSIYNSLKNLGYKLTKKQDTTETKSTLRLQQNSNEIIGESNSSALNNNDHLLFKIDTKVKELLTENPQQNNIIRNESFLTTDFSKSQRVKRPSTYTTIKLSQQYLANSQRQAAEKLDSSIAKQFNESNLSYLKKINVQNKPKSLVITNHQGKPITYSFK